MTEEQVEWLTDFSRKLQDAGERAQDKQAKILLLGKAGTARFILEKMSKWERDDGRTT